MSEQKERPTLKDLSQQLFALKDKFEALNADFQQQNKFKVELKGTEILMTELVNLICQADMVRETAIQTLHQAAYGPVETELDSQYPLDVLHKLTELLEYVLSEALDWQARTGEDPGLNLLMGYCFHINNNPTGPSIEICLQDLSYIAKALAAIFVKEEMGLIEETHTTKETSKVQDEWITVTYAAELAGVKPGTISRSVKEGRIEYNGKKGPDRRISKSSLLLWMTKRKERERQKGYSEYSKILDQIPEKH